jgi:hypothetical protein
MVVFALICAASSSAGAPEETKRAQLHVDAAAAAGGNGSGRAPFQNIPDALAAARALSAEEIVIKVAPGVYPAAATLRLDIPNLELRGSDGVQRDDGGWAVAILDAGTQTRITGTAALAADAAILIAADDVAIRNLSISRSDNKGETIAIQKAQRFTVKDCHVTGPNVAAISAAASSGSITGNYVTGAGCGICVAAGNEDSPAVVEVRANRSVANTNGGLLLAGGVDLSGSGIFNALTATVVRNDFSGNSATSTSFGLRVYAVKRDPPDAFMQSDGNVTASIAENRIHDNTLGIIIDAGFPYRTFKGAADPRAYTAAFDLTFGSNDVASNPIPALITFTRFSTALTPSQLIPNGTANSFKYLVNSTFTIADPLNTLAGYWLDHPERDPYSGDVLLNVLMVNGEEVSRGRRMP